MAATQRRDSPSDESATELSRKSSSSSGEFVLTTDKTTVNELIPLLRKLERRNHPVLNFIRKVAQRKYAQSCVEGAKYSAKSSRHEIPQNIVVSPVPGKPGRYSFQPAEPVIPVTKPKEDKSQKPRQRHETMPESYHMVEGRCLPKVSEETTRTVLQKIKGLSLRPWQRNLLMRREEYGRADTNDNWRQKPSVVSPRRDDGNEPVSPKRPAVTYEKETFDGRKNDHERIEYQDGERIWIVDGRRVYKRSGFDFPVDDENTEHPIALRTRLAHNPRLLKGLHLKPQHGSDAPQYLRKVQKQYVHPGSDPLPRRQQPQAPRYADSFSLNDADDYEERAAMDGSKTRCACYGEEIRCRNCQPSTVRKQTRALSPGEEVRAEHRRLAHENRTRAENRRRHRKPPPKQ